MIHKLIAKNSNNISEIDSKSIQLIITSPPYPMIEMWDKIFQSSDNSIKEDMENGNGYDAFLKMHHILNEVWKECDRVLSDSGFICINIGDATRTLNGNFRLYPNHFAIIDFFQKQRYDMLPDIHWKKPTNSPTKFMGSGMYPAGAYVTYEHEYILIFRKGGKRKFTDKERERRQESAYFWEERNIWFSDIWEIAGTSQKLNKANDTRIRNASFPFEIPYRLVNMYSIKGDTVLDPFCGLGTTNLACIASERNSIGIDIDVNMIDLATKNLSDKKAYINHYISKRIEDHLSFIKSLDQEKKDKCYLNTNHNFLVKTKQETKLQINKLKELRNNNNIFESDYF